MSHYLQRMAAAALRPTSNVHPILDPVFSIQKARAEEVPSLTEETISSVASSINREPTEANAPKELEAPCETDHPSKVPKVPPTPAAEAKPVANKSVDLTSLAQDPLRAFSVESLSQQPTEVSASSLAQPRGVGIDSSNMISPLQKSDQRAKSPEGPKLEPERGLPARRDESFEPLVPLGLVSEEFSRNLVDRPNVPASFIRAKMSGRNGRAQHSKNSIPEASNREPDEVQIHIGRIEVTAVQAGPPPSVAPKPTRWSPSLQEYLRRRDRKGS